jgi:hypothetical protein
MSPHRSSPAEYALLPRQAWQGADYCEISPVSIPPRFPQVRSESVLFPEVPMPIQQPERRERLSFPTIWPERIVLLQAAGIPSPGAGIQGPTREAQAVGGAPTRAAQGRPSSGGHLPESLARAEFRERRTG